MAKAYCVQCSAELATASPALVCMDCAAWLKDGQARYTLLWEGSRAEGPVAFSQVVERMQRGLLGPRDRVSGRGGGGYLRIDQHPDFAPFFIPGDPRHQQIEDQKDAARREVDARARARGAQKLLRAALALAVVGAPVLVWKSGVLDAHQETIDGMKAKVAELFASGSKTVRKAMDDEVALEELREAKGLPAEELVAELTAKYAGASGVVSDRLGLAQTGLLQGTSDGLETARRELEYALVLEPKNAEVVASLAVVYTRLAGKHDNMGAAGLALYERALALGAPTALVARAGAGMALASGGYEDAARKAASCVAEAPEDGLCAWYLGEAKAHLGDYDEALRSLEVASSILGEAPAVGLALAGARLESCRYGGTAESLEAFSARYPDDAGIHAMLMRTYRETGRFQEAVRAADRALALDGGLRDVQLQRALLLHHALGRSAEAQKALRAIAEDSGSGVEARKTAWLHASLAARASGDAKGAVEAATRATALAPGWPAAHLALALALHAAGDDAAAEEALRDAETNGDDSKGEFARFHLEAARFYNALGRARPASFEINAARDLRPDWVWVRLEDAESQLALDNGAGALEAINQTWWMDVEQDTGRDPVVDIPVAAASTRTLAEHLRAKIPAGSSVGQGVPAALAVLEAIECLSQEKDCSRADAALEQVLQIDASSLAANAYKARVELVRKRPDQALKRLDVIVAGQDPHPAILALMMQAKGTLGLSADVEQLLARIGRLTKDGTLVVWRHALALEALGQKDAAVARAVEAARADPGNLRVRRYLLERTKP